MAALSGTGAVNGDTGGANSTETLSIGGDNNNGTFSGVIANDAPADTTFTDVLAIVKAGTGTETLSGANTYSGGSTVNAGTLKLGGVTVLGSTTAITTVAGGATLDVNGQTIGSYAFNLSGTGVGGASALTDGSITAVSLAGNITSTSGSYTIGGSGAISLSGALQGTLTKVGSNNLTLGGITDNTGLSLNVNGGTVILAKSSSTSSVHAVNGSLTINAASVQLVGTGGDQIADNATVTVTADGKFDLEGQSERVQQLSLSAASSTDPALLLNSGSGTSTLTAAVTLTGAGSVIRANNGNVAVTGVMSGSGTLSKQGSATLTLNGANTYSGGTTVSVGTLKLGSATALGNTSGQTDHLRWRHPGSQRPDARRSLRSISAVLAWLGTAL